MPGKNIVFSMTGACGIYGGIATANLSVIRALTDLAEETLAKLTIFSLLETPNDRPEFLPEWVEFRAFEGNKVQFSLRLLQAGLRRPVFCFDRVELALPVLLFAATGILKTVVFAHGSEAWKSIRRSSRWSFQSASLCLTNSQFTLKKMRTRISRFNGEVCYLGLSPDFTLQNDVSITTDGHLRLESVDGSTRDIGKNALLLISRMDSREGQKGHRALINVLPALLNEFPDVQLVLAGPGDDRHNLLQLAKRNGVEASVFLPGYVSGETQERLYRKCYAFAMPSKQEGFGLVYLEAMNYGKPCVGCWDDGAEDVIVHGETGFLVHDPNDPQQLLGVLRTLLGNPELAGTLGIQGLERLHRCFTTEDHQNRIKEKMRSVV